MRRTGPAAASPGPTETAPPDALWAWRHPRPRQAEGRCIGARTDLALDPRRAKRLARRIQRFARRHGLPRVVLSSPLRRCADVGRWLQRWGWVHRIDPLLCEMDFGAWDGLPWAQVPREAVDAWCADFTRHRPGGGESLVALLARAAAWAPGEARLVVAHGGWMLARRWLQQHGAAPARADQWPAAPRHGQCWPLAPQVQASRAQTEPTARVSAGDSTLASNSASGTGRP